MQGEVTKWLNGMSFVNAQMRAYSPEKYRAGRRGVGDPNPYLFQGVSEMQAYVK